MKNSSKLLIFVFIGNKFWIKFCSLEALDTSNNHDPHPTVYNDERSILSIDENDHQFSLFLIVSHAELESPLPEISPTNTEAETEANNRGNLRRILEEIISRHLKLRTCRDKDLNEI
ncbi:hypothetical protein ACH5RR_037154 [Cinchona calisaya]|uniref:Uncharacterized protein n=1 Tax=Cinchona calisaya TaxID=153742 RepID=A0ABD2YA60_9GENT